MGRDGKDLEDCLEYKLDLDDGSKDSIYTAHFFPTNKVPSDIVDPIKKK